ncbi:MAG: hypothetical protein AVDCRST_MAG68-3937 [uncultured Gemmatimonadetes bacterium]|uniref:Response regulatory domain-containing protein n=1 Tax=uncultured Gemmatimonadota bacterium TaxID=203437 RepID=A0A6J4MA45_9BACT|nr:MAG: hypothetical protein AVDCRST_MAG68-3937 [uncultured Gemmatimonadota bacterium]
MDRSKRDAHLSLACGRRDRLDKQLRRAEDFLRESLVKLDALEGGTGEDEASVPGSPSPARTAPRDGQAVPAILVVDLDDRSRAALGGLLRRSGYPVVEAGRSSDLPADEEIAPLLVVFDPGPYFDAALRTIARMRIQQSPPVPVVLLGAALSPEQRDRALAIGCSAVLAKPCAPAELLAAVAGVLEAAPPRPELSAAH